MIKNDCATVSNRDVIACLEALKNQAGKAEEMRQAEAREKAEENRKRMPTIAAWVDEARAIFGDDVKVLYASENGRTVGRLGEQGIKLSETVLNGSFAKKVKR